MTSDVVQMHLAQALTRAENTDVRRHIRAALDAFEETQSTEPADSHLTAVESAETELEAWLAQHAIEGVPEVVLIGVLREYADRIERIGHVPRSWQRRCNHLTSDPSIPSHRPRPNDRKVEK